MCVLDVSSCYSSDTDKVEGQGHDVKQNAVHVIGLWKSTRLIGNQGRRSKWHRQVFDRKLLNGRFCACAVKYF